MRRLLLIVAVVAVAAAVPVTVALAVAPSATTGSATNVSTSAATLNGSVNPGGEATDIHFEYGTTTSYGSSTVLTAIGTGASALAVQANVGGLAAGKTYHFRVVAHNASDTVNGSDRTFVTGTAPSVSTSTATNISSSAATLRATVDPNGLATTYKFQYGTSSSNLNKSTATTSAGAGNGGIAVAANIGGLSSNDRIYFRISANNSAGTRTGTSHSFVTAKSLKITDLAFPRSRYGGSSKITGRLTGSGVSGQTVVVQGNRFPFTGPLAQLASAKANSKGKFTVTVRGITANMRVRVVAAGNVTGLHNLYNGNRVGVKVRKSRRLKFSGVVTPIAPNGLVRIQRRKSNGKWHNVRKGKLKVYTNGRSRYSLSAHRSKGVYRVQVLPRDGGAHASGYSRKVRVR